MDLLETLISAAAPFKEGLLVVLGAVVSGLASFLQARRTHDLEETKEGRDHLRTLMQKFIEQRDNAHEESEGIQKHRLAEMEVIAVTAPDDRRRLVRGRFRSDATRRRLTEIIEVLRLRDHTMVPEYSGIRPGVANRVLCDHAVKVIESFLHGKRLPRPVEELVTLRTEIPIALKEVWGESTPDPFIPPNQAYLITQIRRVIKAQKEKQKKRHEASAAGEDGEEGGS